MEHSNAAEQAKEIVSFWKNRHWLPSKAPIHIHELDLTKLEELITKALEDCQSPV